jgi:hypothetical protein
LKVRLFLNLNKDRRINQLQKQEAALRERIGSQSTSLQSIQQDLQICVTQYHRIKAIGMLERRIAFLAERSILLEKSFKNPTELRECLPVLQNVAWGLHRLNSEQAPEFIAFFRPILGDISHSERFVDREVAEDH